MRLAAILALLVCGGCQQLVNLVIGTLPEPDPVWKVAFAAGPHDQKQGCLPVTPNGTPVKYPDIFPRGSSPSGIIQTCSTPERRVKSYLGTFLPSSTDAFQKQLQSSKFQCATLALSLAETNSSITQCSYTESFVPRPCFGGSRVAILVTFPSKKPELAADDLHLQVSIARDRELHDTRGCMPL
jgi:hypothetical protein